jgi:hypothetical protein
MPPVAARSLSSIPFPFGDEEFRIALPSGYHNKVPRLNLRLRRLHGFGST